MFCYTPYASTIDGKILFSRQIFLWRHLACLPTIFPFWLRFLKASFQVGGTANFSCLSFIVLNISLFVSIRRRIMYSIVIRSTYEILRTRLLILASADAAWLFRCLCWQSVWHPDEENVVLAKASTSRIFSFMKGFWSVVNDCNLEKLPLSMKVFEASEVIIVKVIERHACS